MSGLDIIIFAGQSNMQGQAEGRYLEGAVPGAYEYRFLTDSIRPLADPVGENIRPDGREGYPPCTGDIPLSQWLADHTLGQACGGNACLAPAACAAVHAATGREVLAIHAAKGSTEIHQWLPGTEGYASLVRKVQAGIRKAGEHHTVRSVSLLWLQGESDALFHCPRETYAARLIALGEAMQRDFGLERFGLIRVGHFCKTDWDEGIIAAQEEVCAAHPLFSMLTRLTEELEQHPENMNPHVGGHFGAAGLQKLGRAAGEALAKLL
ncbi:MAG: hypothetical protein IKL89_02670 [Clostridia bacterium]|nr:hypothetical protein [Clostridia bacterium]